MKSSSKAKTPRASKRVQRLPLVFEWEFRQGEIWRVFPRELEGNLEVAFCTGLEQLEWKSRTIVNLRRAVEGMAEEVDEVHGNVWPVRRREFFLHPDMDIESMEWDWFENGVWRRHNAANRLELETGFRSDKNKTIVINTEGTARTCDFLRMRQTVCETGEVLPIGEVLPMRRQDLVALEALEESEETEFASWIQPITRKLQASDICIICQDEIYTRVVSLKCKCPGIFHRDCIYGWFKQKAECPVCKKMFGDPKGDSPPGLMNWGKVSGSLSGYENCGIIEISYSIPSGTQGPSHPAPGKRFMGTSRLAYLPDNADGRRVLKLLKKAFDCGITFTVGTSLTTGQSNCVVWTGIHHKTSAHGGTFGYPDPTYLQRVEEELCARGISE